MTTVKPKAKPKKEVSPSRLKFAKTLLRRRKERGYATAYAFFHKNGAKKHFNFSYLHYLFIERGLRLPSKEGLRIILDSLGRVGSYSDERCELLTLYLKALVDGDALFDPVLERPARASGEGVPKKDETSEEAILRMTAMKQISSVPRMSNVQLDAIMASPTHFWVLYRLLQTGQKLSADELARAVRAQLRDVMAALEHLIKARLVEKTKSGLFACPHFESDIFEPMRSMTTEKNLWLADRVHEKVKEYGEKHFYSFFLLALDEEEKTNLLTQMMRQALCNSYMFRPHEPVNTGNLVAVEVRVAPVMAID